MSDNRLDYSKYRYEKAKEDLETARKNFQDGFYAAANNRAYYSVFHAIRSILILDWFDSKKHSGVISRFREAYIKTGILPDKVSDAIKETISGILIPFAGTSLGAAMVFILKKNISAL